MIYEYHKVFTHGKSKITVEVIGIHGEYVDAKDIQAAIDDLVQLAKESTKLPIRLSQPPEAVQFKPRGPRET